ncbi:hypothetical protein HMPREF9265_1617 [Limosilactobacillus oris PB013-T2-3]|uniref:Uncharacterized protein n=1 Tax=Limosilactobacillus oris PB013-T2-3 TaxID=908339 RepID=E3C591_9LACO|nr:hypothetical protein HMPREF9265_1617 [Limosilactobacillus oris PB013-T2-3]
MAGEFIKGVELLLFLHSTRWSNITPAWSYGWAFCIIVLGDVL